MSKELAKRIAEWSVNVSYNKLPPKVVHEAKKRIIDSLGVALGAFNEEPVRIARRIAYFSSSSGYAGTIWGTPYKVMADHATFVNGCATRYFDFNDTYLGKEALHPSDNIPALIAVAEAEDADGRRLIEGIIVAYEVAARLADAYSIRARGWDHVTYIAISSAVGAAKIMGLDVEKTRHAINLAVVANNALRQTRVGEISMWKGCAAANAARNGVFAALLAKYGMTGPAPIFEGEMGFFKLVSMEAFDIPVMGGERDEPYKILQTSIKYWPVEYHAMSAVEAALRIVEKHGGPLRPDEIERIDVKTFDVAYKIIVKDPEKWDPKTRETADHSLPYIIAAALLDGKIWLDTFKPQRYLAQDVRKVMAKMKIVVDPEHDALYPEGIKNTIIVTLKDGRRLEESSTYPPGHWKNPLSDTQVEEKFWRLVGDKLADKDAGKEALKAIWRIEEAENISRILRGLQLKEASR
ncbi:MAG: MmgE/PrpD family protein [Pyrodictiaceae archaeon]